jgi:hypothetical protein
MSLKELEQERKEYEKLLMLHYNNPYGDVEVVPAGVINALPSGFVWGDDWYSEEPFGYGFNWVGHLSRKFVSHCYDYFLIIRPVEGTELKWYTRPERDKLVFELLDKK